MNISLRIRDYFEKERKTICQKWFPFMILKSNCFYFTLSMKIEMISSSSECHKAIDFYRAFLSYAQVIRLFFREILC